MTLLVTGGAGFFGSKFVLDWLAAGDEPLVHRDALSDAGHRASLAPALERAIGWDDPQLAIDGPLPAGTAPRPSPRNAQAPLLAQAELPDAD